MVELLRMAMQWQRQLGAGRADGQAEIARREGITQARVTQIMAMLRLPPEIREQIPTMPESVGRPSRSADPQSASGRCDPLRSWMTPPTRGRDSTLAATSTVPLPLALTEPTAETVAHAVALPRPVAGHT